MRSFCRPSPVLQRTPSFHRPSSGGMRARTRHQWCTTTSCTSSAARPHKLKQAGLRASTMCGSTLTRRAWPITTRHLLHHFRSWPGAKNIGLTGSKSRREALRGLGARTLIVCPLRGAHGLSVVSIARWCICNDIGAQASCPDESFNCLSKVIKSSNESTRLAGGIDDGHLELCGPAYMAIG